MVVPELPQSRSAVGAVNLPWTPCTTWCVGETVSTLHPQLAQDPQCAEAVLARVRNCSRCRCRPTGRPSIAARCEMLLSPGTLDLCLDPRGTTHANFHGQSPRRTDSRAERACEQEVVRVVVGIIRRAWLRRNFSRIVDQFADAALRFGAILREDGGPQIRRTGGHARGVAESSGTKAMEIGVFPGE